MIYASQSQPIAFTNVPGLEEAGITVDMIAAGVAYTYEILEAIDEKLVASGAFRLAKLIELANLSSVLGNLLGSGIAGASKGIFQRNGPHKYPDLVAQQPNAQDIEIKMALEDNRPKGHLAKPGYYLACRYVLCDDSGRYTSSQRGDVARIWEIRFGQLNENDFNISNTPGDSGKTAVVNSNGMDKLQIVFLDLERCPLPKGGRVFREATRQYVYKSPLIK